MSTAVSAFTWQPGFLQIMPIVQTHAQIQFRHLPKVHKEEATQEAIAAAYVGYHRAAVQGKLDVLRASKLADFAVRHVRAGRHVGGHQDAAKDVMSPVCQNRHGVRVKFETKSGNSREGWRQIVIADRRARVPDLAAFKIDFAQWLRMRSRRDRSIISALITGENPSAVADRFGLTRGRVSQLRRRYEEAWLDFQGEPESPAVAA